MSDQGAIETMALPEIQQIIPEVGEIPTPAVLEQAIVQATPEAENAPSWFGQVVKRVSDAWFEPKSFEQNPEVYEKLGVRTYKKYVPTSGDLVRRLVWKRFGDESWVKGNVDSLKSMERFTRIYEGIHATFLGVGVATMAAQLQAGQIEGAAFTAGLNTLVNVYPIMTQRYNRSRLYRTIHKMEERQQNSNQPPKPQS
ncbi:hypothetical protein A3E66_04680 [Candidatus Daviesbacteria bacterium RIFCSPHIGHO2_12_FULL_37_16]|uniref:Glycosyl-4,4'-diaponeurosporenoate acyltransferase n=3 Tax=Candidatus Daviesiibacteriota TaxID=1752718 RepID=A0A0G0EPH7_9BACT|nr:MAG: hypothetical protein US19_C0018G0025 [Candidatus Daviesbacteria bacterium GW2011_GWB1_36_5]KKQ13798.1 MAG: hypothetical protein US28_C0044G0001 [Candidatus Daviesbacteria bacterium GW2011_GWA1_36_8]OGE34875.1 MAG: hypothetical protein A3E66_04680 [Candidatus Daviesbacteria bacterium RIFCSPHIGHO2_12_FULL_37_16]